MSGEVLKSAFELINLSRVAPYVPIGAEALIGTDWKGHAETVKNLGNSFSEELDFLKNLAKLPPLGPLADNYDQKKQISISESALSGMVQQLKSQPDSGERERRMRIVEGLEIVRLFVSDQKFFSNRMTGAKFSIPPGRIAD